MSAPTPEDMASWPAPNYVDPETRVPETLGIVIGGMALMMIFVVGRVTTRFDVKSGFGIDDWIIMVAVVTTVSTSILGCISTQYGGGHHLYDMKPEWVPIYGKMALAMTTLFNACVTFPKLSLCFTYLRLFPSQGNRVFCYTLIVFLTGFIISSCLATVLQCLPIESYWDQTITDKTCINTSAFSVAVAALNSATDFLVFWWPARSLWRIQLPLRQRLGLIFVFAIGSMVCVAGVVRMWYIDKLFKGYEFYYDGAVILYTASIEWNLGIIFACMHSVKPILAQIFPRLFGSVDQGSNYKYASFSTYNKKQLAGMVQSKNSEFQTIPQDYSYRSNGLSSTTGSGPRSPAYNWDKEEIELPEKATIQCTRQFSVQSGSPNSFERNDARV